MKKELPQQLLETVNKPLYPIQREGRVCAGNPGRVSCTFQIRSFQNFNKVLKTCTAGRKYFFDTLKELPQQLLFSFTYFCFSSSPYR